MTGIDLVTGGSGFLGGHVVQALAERGRAVRILDVQAPDRIPEGVEVVEGSVTDEAIVRHAMTDVRRIFHLAAIPELWCADPSRFEAVNHQGTRTVLAAAMARPHLDAFVYTSSEVVLVPNRRHRLPHRLDESVDLPPEALIGPYADAKRRGEQAVLAAAGRDFPAVSVIPTMPLGPGDVNRTPPTRMIADLLTGRTPAYADVLLNVVDARDCALSHIQAVERATPGRRYLLSGHNVTMSALLAELSLVTEVVMPSRRIPKPLARAFAYLDTFVADRLTGKPPTAPRDGVEIACRQRPFDNARARDELDFRTRPLSITLADTVAWLSETSGTSSSGSARVSGIL